jgi:hypothetical protein
VIDPTFAPLAGWESFYVIVGSSAAALIGLNFVVVALGAEGRTIGGQAEIAAFGTPTIMHFSGVLLVAAIISSPWRSLNGPALCLVTAGLAGLCYSAIVVRRARRQTGYAPVLEDWIWHAALPLAAYAILLVGAIALRWRPAAALFDVALAELLLLYIGIHNAWDAVTFIAVERPKRPE